MSRTDYRTLIDRGRKAGLRTSELYQALSTRPMQAGEANQQTDGNGYESHLNANGRPVFEPRSAR